MTSQRANAFSKKIMVQQQDSGGWDRSAAILAGRVKRFGRLLQELGALGKKYLAT
ncbi:hypothetical protein [Mesorhizobium sp.]|uniref:hypothetical protein n=1 Tax=Mesorhizobium sp. TaxID=1871066 RepID=UPI00257C7015|nr:hypothetical protein [Mesorhizobium sp.]